MQFLSRSNLLGYPVLFMFKKITIQTAPENQWRSGPVTRTQNTTDNNGMVPSIMLRMGVAVKPGQCSRQNGRPFRTEREVDAIEVST